MGIFNKDKKLASVEDLFAGFRNQLDAIHQSRMSEFEKNKAQQDKLIEEVNVLKQANKEHAKEVERAEKVYLTLNNLLGI